MAILSIILLVVGTFLMMRGLIVTIIKACAYIIREEETIQLTQQWVELSIGLISIVYSIINLAK